MNNKLFYHRALPRSAIDGHGQRLSATLAALTALCALPMASAVMAGDAPAWMHAQVTVPMPAHEEKAGAVLLYSETVLTVLPNGKMKRLVREAYKILRPEGQSRGVVRVDFDDQSRIINLHGWCIPVAGKDYEVKERDAIETSLPGVANGELVSDLRTKLLQIPAATPGNIVGYEFEQEQRPYDMADEWDFQDTVPVREAHYTLQLPPGWGYSATWVNHPEIAPDTTVSGQSRWVVSDLKAIRIEPQMPPFRGIEGKLAISLIAPNSQSHGFQSWQDVGNWYLKLVAGRRDASPAIKQKAAELTANVPTTLGKMQALADFVQNQIRYVAIELGIGGYQPHSAADVFVHRYGDCKDKVTLLASMLEQVGIDSNYVIINTERGSIGASTPPNLGFNHVILAIRLPDDVTDNALQALLPDQKRGRILIFDPTDPLTPFGALSGPLQANYGLLVTPDGSDLVKLPQLPPDANSLQRTAQFTLDENGTLRGDVQEVRVGDQASEQRYVLRATTQDTDRIKPIEALLADSFGTFAVEKAGVLNLHATDRPFEWRYTLTAEKYAKFTGELLMVRPRVLGSKSSGFLETKEPRENSVEFEGPERDTDLFEIALPPGYQVAQLPAPVSAQYDFASYESKTQLVGQTLRYTRTLVIKDLDIPVAEAEQLKMFYRTIFRDERTLAVLERTTH